MRGYDLWSQCAPTCGVLPRWRPHARDLGLSFEFATVESTAGSSNTGVRIDFAAGQVAHSSCGAVQLMFSMQNEENFQGSCEFGIRGKVRLTEVVFGMK